MTEGRSIHRLKTWPRFYLDVVEGRKSFEWRRDDRGFEVGDRLILEEFDPAADVYSGQSCAVLVTSILRGPDFCVPDEFVVMSIRHIDGTQADAA